MQKDDMISTPIAVTTWRLLSGIDECIQTPTSPGVTQSCLWVYLQSICSKARKTLGLLYWRVLQQCIR